MADRHFVTREELAMRRMMARGLRYAAMKYGMTTKWQGSAIMGYDRILKTWIKLVDVG